MHDLSSRIMIAAKTRETTQTGVATAVGVTQGHLSKVLRGKVSLTPGLRARLEKWLDAAPPDGGPDADAVRIVELARAVHMQCIEMQAIAERLGIRSGSPEPRVPPGRAEA